MKGTNHIITGVSSAVILDTYVKVISDITSIDMYHTMHRYFLWSHIFGIESEIGQVAVTVLVVVLNFAMFILGCLLPDSDQEHSTIGRIIHIPVRHRTWTHTIWAVGIFAAISLFVPCFTFLTYGYILHIFFDSLSKGGICWFYPFSQYKIWTSGAQVKKNHKIYLYRTGETSEKVLTTFIVLAGVSALIYNILLTVGVNFGDLPFHAK